jgi:hypothetical protein
MQEPQLITVGVIADTLHVPLHRVLYALRTRKNIQPAARAGIIRLYRRESVEQVRQALAAKNRRTSQAVAP